MAVGLLNMLASSLHKLKTVVQVYQCVDHQYNIIDCSTVCLVHNCQPQEERQQCSDSFYYKTVRVQPGGEHRCKDAVCQPKSGTCQNRRGKDALLISH